MFTWDCSRARIPVCLPGTVAGRGYLCVPGTVAGRGHLCLPGTVGGHGYLRVYLGL